MSDYILKVNVNQVPYLCEIFDSKNNQILNVEKIAINLDARNDASEIFIRTTDSIINDLREIVIINDEIKENA